MKRRIEQLINGRYEYEVPKLLISETQITAETKAGENFRGELHISAEDGRKIKGIAVSSHRRFLLGREHFAGTEVKIPYGVDVKGLNPGDVCQGEVTLNTGIGAYKVSFCISILANQVRTSVGDIESLDEFVQLVMADYREAFHLFVDDAFSVMLDKEEEKLWQVYQGMSKNPVTYQHLEEFLIGIGKKEPVHISLENDNIAIYEIQNSLKDTLQVKKSNWGFVRIEVEAQGDFLEIEKRIITPEDFIGSTYGLDYIIRKEKLGKGRNYGRIIFKTVYETKVYEITASKYSEIQINASVYEKKRRLTLARLYLDLLAHRIPYRTWYEESMERLREMQDTGYADVRYQLMQAYVHYTAEEIEEVDEIMDRIKKGAKAFKDSPELEGMYLYINRLAERLPKDKQDITPRLHALFEKQEDSFLLVWLLLREDEDLNRIPQKKLYMLARQYERGCRSPFLYMEAYQILADEDALLRKLTPFMIHVLYFAKKQGLFTDELAFRAAYLSGYLKNFSQTMYEILCFAYEKNPQKDVLEAICKLIMKGEPRRKEYFPWYELAVEQELRITRLYEYYIETMSSNYKKMLPQMIRMYFSYNNTLGDMKKAFVYANVVRNKKLDKVTYQSYSKAMEEFAKARLLEGKMNEDFAVLYQQFCVRKKDDKIRQALAKLLFTHRIYVDDPKIRQIVVIHGALKEEAVYSCSDQMAYVQIYTKEAEIIFEDDRRRRYVSTIDYTMQRMLNYETIVPKLLENDIEDSGFILHVCGEPLENHSITEGTISYYQRALLLSDFREGYQQKVRQKLLEYYRGHMEQENLQNSLNQLDFRAFALVNKSLLVDILVNQGMYLGAYDLICEYGYEEVPLWDMLRLCSHMILNMEFKYEEELLLLAYYVFSNGEYDEIILKYLSLLYEGPVEAMIEVWERAKEFHVEDCELEERILSSAMFTRTYTHQAAQILEDYMKQSGKQQVILAYLTFEAFGYFLGDRETSEFIFQCLEEKIREHREVDDICHLALLKYYAEQEQWTKDRIAIGGQLMAACAQKGLRFAFMQKLPGEFLRSYQFDDKVFVEYKGSPLAKVTLFYRLEGSDEEAEYKSEPLKNMYHGIYNKEFILFYGEKLTYYFNIENEEESINTQSIVVTMADVPMEGETKYQMLNQMLAAQNRGDEEALQKILEKYLHQEKLTERVFQIME